MVESSSHFQHWMATEMENITHFTACPLKTIQLTTLIQESQTPSTIVMSEEGRLLNSINIGLTEFDGFIVAISDCRIADLVVESITSKTDAPILRLDFVACTKVAPTTPIATGKISVDNVERLSLFRLNASAIISN